MRHSDRDPDKKALDELSRAFSDDDPGDYEGVRIVYPSSDHDDGDDDLDATAPTPVSDRDADHGAGDDGGGDADDVPGEADHDRDAAAPKVISISDDELPDAAYVSGSLDGDNSAPVVIIEDDDSGDALQPEAERDMRRGIEPRMSERRKAVKRAAGRKRLIWAGVGVGTVIVIVALLTVLGSGLFAVDRDSIRVSGATYADQSELDRVLDDLAGTPALLADESAFEAQLEAIPWVRSAKVDVNFPSSASIEIREREALTTYAGPDGRYRVLDREGRVLDIIDGYPIAYVLITSPEVTDLEIGEFGPRGFAAASELVRNLTPTVRPRVEHIEVASDGSSLVLVLRDQSRVNFGAANDLLSKLVRLEALLGKYPDLADADLDVSTRETSLATAETLEAARATTVPADG